jgi:hypothetical protein
MPKAHAKRQGQTKTTKTIKATKTTKTTQPTRTSRGTASRRSSTPSRTRQPLGDRIEAAPASARRSKEAEKLGISNHPLTEEVERQRRLPPRGTQRKTTPAGDEVKRPVEPAPVRRRGRGQDREMPAEE